MKELETSEAITAKRLNGNERFHLDGKELPMLKASVKEFWSWSYSDILNNTTRGVLAEFLSLKLWIWIQQAFVRIGMPTIFYTAKLKLKSRVPPMYNLGTKVVVQNLQ